METYFLAGSADDYDAALAEYIGDYLVKRHPKVGFVKDLRHPCEWTDFRKSVCDSRGFDLPGTSPLIWRKTGLLIGTAQDFKKFVKEKYSIEVALDESLMRAIQKENQETAQKASEEDAWTPLVGSWRKVWKDGTIFDGTWKDHKPKKGTLTFSDTSTYTGTLVDSKFHGSGLRKYADGSKFRGLYTYGKREGIGSYQDADGNEYDGYYVNDKCHGKGTRKWASGRIYSGEWRENKASGSGSETIPADGGQLVYQGQFLDGKRHGRGSMKYPGGATYDGEWHEGRRHGAGNMSWGGDAELSFAGVFLDDAAAHGTLRFDGGDMTAAYPGEVWRMRGLLMRGALMRVAPASPRAASAVERQRRAARRAPQCWCRGGLVRVRD